MDHLLEPANKVTAAYHGVGSLAFAYGQGSVVAGFTERSAIDLVMIWDRSAPPRPGRRPVAVLHEGSTSQAAQYDHLDYVVDKFLIGDRQFSIAHHTLSTFDKWVSEVQSGHGWEEVDQPEPLYAVAGFSYGRLLLDDRGLGEEARQKLSEFPSALVDRTRAMLLAEMPSYDEDLDDCVRRNDGWLFHDLLSRVHRHALVTWFAAEHKYCPHPKWLHQWIRRLGLNQSIASTERAMWGPVNLARRQELFLTMVERVISLPRKTPS